MSISCYNTGLCCTWYGYVYILVGNYLSIKAHTEGHTCWWHGDMCEGGVIHYLCALHVCMAIAKYSAWAMHVFEWFGDAHMHMHMHTRMHMHAHAHVHAHVHTHTCTHAHACAHACTPHQCCTKQPISTKN